MKKRRLQKKSTGPQLMYAVAKKIRSHNLIKLPAVCLLLLCLSVAGFAQVTYPTFTRSDIYTFFDPGSRNMPAGSAMAAGAVMCIQRIYDGFQETGTGFLIRTPDDKGKVGLMLAGHHIRAILGRDGIIGETIPFNAKIALNYRAKDSLSDGRHYTQLTSLASGFLDVGELKGYIMDENTQADIALVLIDKEKLPVASYSELGYDFSDIWDATARYYSISHTSFYPQLITDNMEIVRRSLYRVNLTATAPYAIGGAGSGAPLISRPVNATDVWAVRGVFVSIYEPLINPPKNIGYNDDIYHSSYSSAFSKINLLESAIRQYCWKKTDSNQIATSASYKQSVTVNNPGIAAFQADRRFGSIDDLLSSAGAIIERQLIYHQQTAIDMVSYYLRCKTLQSLNFPVPNKYPAAPFANLGWLVSLVGQTIEMNAGFEYTASDNSELNAATMNTVTESSDAAMRKTTAETFAKDTNETTGTTEFKVYPNPASDGLFHVSLPLEGYYRAVVRNLEGKEVYQATCNTNPFQLNLSAVVRGTYLLQLFDQKNAKAVYQQLIVY